MTITEIRDALTRLIDQGHGEKLLQDSENPTFSVDDISVTNCITHEKEIVISIEWDEVK